MTLFRNKLMLENASYMFFLKKKPKQNKITTKKSLTRQESNLRPSTCKGNALSIAPHNQSVCQLLYLHFCAHEINYSSEDGAENADVQRNEYHKRSPLSTTGISTEYQRNPKIICCVFLFTLNATNQSQN